MVDPILSPSAAMAEAGGPRKRMPLGVSSSASGSSGFSEAWPLWGSNSCARSAVNVKHVHCQTQQLMHNAGCHAAAQLSHPAALPAHQPGQTASTPVRIAVATISCTLA